MHILHLEDSSVDAELIHDLLRLRWPEVSINTVQTRTEFESAVLRGDFDLIISDYSLPAYNGLAALSFTRIHRPDKPFIYLSGTIGEERAIEALRSGASDYIIKDRPGRLIPAIEDALKQGDMEKAKRAAEKKMAEQAALLGKAREAICAIDPDRRITYWNASAERLYGCKADAVIGRDLRRVLYRADSTAVDEAYAAVLASGEWRGELQPRNSRDESLLVESFWSLVTDDQGLATSILIVEADISEKKRIEAQLMQTQRLETLGLLAGGIAHDLNNVLSPIINSIEFLNEIVTQPKDRELIESLEMSANHGADLVRQLMAFARGTVEQVAPVPPGSLIAGACRLVRHTMPASITVSTSVSDDLPVVHADSTQLRQVLLNLCINARDAMPGGGTIEISADQVSVPAGSRTVQGEVKAGSYVRITVADTGIGIPPGIVGKLFEPFFTTKKPGKGTGLGLANVAGIVKAHGGFIDLESTPGEGTRFFVHLPVGLPASTDVLHPAPVVDIRKGAEEILVIEDDDAIRRILQLVLGASGYAVTVVQDGPQGLSLLRANPGRFPLVITDLNMPGISGLDLIRELRSSALSTKIIVQSGLPDAVQDSEGVEVLSKPISAERLLQTVRRVLDAPPCRPALAAA
jgi:two-component system, cell cycle sensor histidine kinase and response regulator CckA